MLDAGIQRKLVQALASVPATYDAEGRNALLLGLPPNVIASLRRSNGQLADLTIIITQLQGLGRLENTGERPLIIIAQNALLQVAGTSLGEDLKTIIQDLEHYYGGDPPSTALPAVPEILIFEGRDERVPYSFIEKALNFGRSIVRLRVPRVFEGRVREGECGYGTGWLITQTLMLTNHHVIAVRLPGEPPPSEADYHAQVSKTAVWFDYYLEGGAYTEHECVELVQASEALDYALVRLGNTPEQESRSPLPVIRDGLSLYEGYRLNIIQHPRGGPLKYAIRNNYYLSSGDTTDFIRYLTDTEAGSSGSPVLNDSWQVIGMHHAHRMVPAVIYKGDVVKYHNQGILIGSILNHLPSTVRQEIEEAQGLL